MANPDLIINDVEVDGNSIDSGELIGTSFLPDDTIDLIWDVDNIGDGFASSSEVGIYILIGSSFVFLESDPTSSISAGGSRNNEDETITLPDDLAPDLYAITLIADDDNDLTQSNTSNDFFPFSSRSQPTISLRPSRSRPLRRVSTRMTVR